MFSFSRLNLKFDLVFNSQMVLMHAHACVVYNVSKFSSKNLFKMRLFLIVVGSICFNYDLWNQKHLNHLKFKSYILTMTNETYCLRKKMIQLTAYSWQQNRFVTESIASTVIVAPAVLDGPMLWTNAFATYAMIETVPRFALRKPLLYRSTSPSQPSSTRYYGAKSSAKDTISWSQLT